MHFILRESPRSFAVALALSLPLLWTEVLLATDAPIASTEWVGASEVPGSWFDASKWSGGVPDTSDVAEIAGGGEVHIRRGRAEASLLRLSLDFDRNHASNHLRQSGGELRITDELFIDDGQYDLDGGRLSVGEMRLGSSLFFLPTNDTLTLPPETLPLPPGTITPIPIEPIEIRFPVQQFHQSGGGTNIEQRLSIHSGGAHVSGGRLQADSILIDVSIFQLSNGATDRAFGMEQSNGLVRVRNELLIQNNSYQLSGGVLHVDRIAIGDPAMEDSSPISFSRLPEFIQTGGLNMVTGNLELCVPGFTIGNLRPFISANYRLEGGTLRVAGDAIVGSLGEAPVNFMQSAGKANIGGTLRIEGASSRYELGGGRLSTKNLEIGLGIFNTGGTFAITKPAPANAWFSFLPSEQVTVHNRISLGEESMFEAVPGSRMRLAGGKFENFSTHPENLAGLNNLQLTIGDQSWVPFRSFSPQVTEFEVAGLDLGDVEEGYVENFALDTLQVGGLSRAHLKLIDLVDNQPDSGSPEALYVDHLVVGWGSTLDLGGVSIYYRTAQIFGNVINSSLTLASIIIVPEPASALLLLIGTAFCRRRRECERPVSSRLA
jgi:hypothetical protein